ncbi:Hypothetical predicted protein [Mytilus galloprovincialis]|uniref:Uncharacterized protein n=1 Tax=Mytilus galloprovincialis TaxID=29158 RepID=A0A8B6HNH5_MYTGA|nr:Hypothetical predicted protein [Mytilus galloprovincialis]
MEETNRMSEVEEESDTVGISITGSTGTREKMARTGNKTTDIEMKLFSLEESVAKRFDKLFGLLQAAHKIADSSHTGGSATQENDITRMDNVPVQRERRPLTPLEPNLNEERETRSVGSDFRS